MRYSGTKRRYAASNATRRVPGEVENAAALFDDDEGTDEDNYVNRNGGSANDPFAFQNSDGESYDEHRRQSLLQNRGESEDSDSDNSVVPPSQSEGDSDGGETSVDEDDEF